MQSANTRHNFYWENKICLAHLCLPIRQLEFYKTTLSLSLVETLSVCLVRAYLDPSKTEEEHTE